MNLYIFIHTTEDGEHYPFAGDKKTLREWLEAEIADSGVKADKRKFDPEKVAEAIGNIGTVYPPQGGTVEFFQMGAFEIGEIRRVLGEAKPAASPEE